MKKTLYQHAMRSLIFSAILFLGLPTAYAQTISSPTEKQVQEIETLMAPQRKKIIAVLEADKTGKYTAYKTDLQNMLKETDRTKQKALAGTMKKNHYTFIQNACTTAGIKMVDLKRQVSTILGHSQFTFDEFGNITLDISVPPAALSPRFNTEFHCPMEVVDEQTSNQAVAASVSQSTDCSVDIQSAGEIIGGTRGSGGSGGKFEIPEGTFTAVKVAAQSDLSYYGIIGAIGGYAQVNAKSGIRFRAPGIDKKVFAKEVFAIAPLIWFVIIEGKTDNFLAQSTFSGTFSQGNTITAQVYAEAFAFTSALFAIPWVNVDNSNFDFIRLSGSN